MFKKKSQTEENKSDKSKTQRKILCCIKKLKFRVVKSTAAEPTTSEVEEESEGSEVEEEDVDQLQLMIDYINQDACEKADEIDTKTAELFLTEKAKHFEEEYSKIYEYYDKMETKYQASIHRFAANAINKGRLFVLRARANYVVEIIDEARGTLDTIANPQNQKYIETMKLLILEGLLMFDGF
ncbi:V-type proton ATPase subunit E-like [Chrysoperla carnea]|uniref:V-type proton ATPase subunit E-like n=1 Tax=Chrysoperla carnea TaxID=189513 RepID=UPI001D05C36A|nr:V-type proton ATPase subunit E-like [Chrysoperla carnea]